MTFMRSLYARINYYNRNKLKIKKNYHITKQDEIKFAI